MVEKIKVAVIGSGLAGLTTAYKLSTIDDEYEIHIFEKRATLGMDASSITLPVPSQEPDQDWRIDVPMRSFQGGYYPQVIALYKRLGVQFRKADFSYSFSMLSTAATNHRITTAMIYNGSSGLAGVGMPSALAVSDNYPSVIQFVLKAWNLLLFVLLTGQLLACYLRLLFLSMPFFRPPDVKAMKFKQWAVDTVPNTAIAKWFKLDTAWKDFTQFVLLPLFSAVCTASLLDVAEHPVEEFLDYIWLTIGTHHYVVTNGVRDVVSKLTRHLPRTQNIHLSSPITSVEVDPDDANLIAVHCHAPDGAKMYPGFNHIVFATEAPRAIPLLSSYLSSLPAGKRREFVQEQIECLKQFKYISTLVINHTDDSLLPNCPADRRDLNLVHLDPLSSVIPSTVKSVESDASSPRMVSSTFTMATHILRRPKGFPAHLPDVFQTTNPIVEPREGRILSVARLERAVLTMQSKKALRDLHLEGSRGWWRGGGRLGRLQGYPDEEHSGPGIWICGSFAYPGIPLLEGALVSATLVADQIAS